MRDLGCPGAGRTQNGLGNRLPVDYPTVWQVSGAGRAFFIPYPASYPLSIFSECAVIRPERSVPARDHR